LAKRDGRIAGYLSSTLIRMIGRGAMPWRKLF
jgi:hypothetical protein